MFKNVAGQKLTVYAFDSTTALPKTGDAGNLTAYVDKDDLGVTVLTDTSATEKDATNAKGYYIFDLAQAETNASKLMFSAKSSTANIVVIAVPAVVYTGTDVVMVDGSGLRTHVAGAIPCDLSYSSNPDDLAWLNGLTAIGANADTSSGAVQAIVTVESTADVVDAVWDELRSGHVIVGSFGQYVKADVVLMATGVITSDAIDPAATITDSELAGIIWDEARSGHILSGSFGEVVADFVDMRTHLTNARADKLANLDVAVSTRLAPTTAGRTLAVAVDGSVTGVGGSGGSAGSGADSVTMTWTNTTTSLPVADGDVWIASDAAGTNVVAGTLQTDSQGHVTFLLDAGVTYYFFAQKDGVNSVQGRQFTAVAD